MCLFFGQNPLLWIPGVHSVWVRARVETTSFAGTMTNRQTLVLSSGTEAVRATITASRLKKNARRRVSSPPQVLFTATDMNEEFIQEKLCQQQLLIIRFITNILSHKLNFPSKCDRLCIFLASFTDFFCFCFYSRLNGMKIYIGHSTLNPNKWTYGGDDRCLQPSAVLIIIA